MSHGLMGFDDKSLSEALDICDTERADGGISEAEIRMMP